MPDNLTLKDKILFVSISLIVILSIMFRYLFPENISEWFHEMLFTTGVGMFLFSIWAVFFYKKPDSVRIKRYLILLLVIILFLGIKYSDTPIIKEKPYTEEKEEKREEYRRQLPWADDLEEAMAQIRGI